MTGGSMRPLTPGETNEKGPEHLLRPFALRIVYRYAVT